MDKPIDVTGFNVIMINIGLMAIVTITILLIMAFIYIKAIRSIHAYAYIMG